MLRWMRGRRHDRKFGCGLLNCVETRGQREERALSRAIEAKENGECGWRNREGHVDERLTRPITMAHALDRQRGRVDCCHCVHLRWMFESRTGDRAGCFGVEYACRGWRWGRTTVLRPLARRCLLPISFLDEAGCRSKIGTCGRGATLPNVPIRIGKR